MFSLLKEVNVTQCDHRTDNHCHTGNECMDDIICKYRKYKLFVFKTYLYHIL